MDGNILISIFQLVVLLFSVIIHEVSHGFVAYRLGDTTAKDAGRLTLNPISHLDPFGSVILPLALFIFRSPVLFGWAKPVPFNPYNLKNPKKDSGLIALAGPGSNLLVAFVFGLLLWLAAPIISAPLVVFLSIVVKINIVLAVFNLVPIPPLDGSKILFSFLPRKYEHYYTSVEPYGMYILLFFLFFGFWLIIPIINAIYLLFTGGIF